MRGADAPRPLQGLGGAVPPAPDWFTAALAASYEALEVEVDGVVIEGRAWGRRGDPVVVLVHGNAAHLGWWAFLAPMLAVGRRVIALSLSGMGASGWREHYSTDHFVKEMWAIADAGGAREAAGPPTLIGHSAGGMPVLSAAAGERPVRAAVIVDTTLPSPEMAAFRPDPRSSRTYPDLATALERFRLSPSQPCENAYIADYIARLGLKQLPGGDYDWRFDRRLWLEVDFGLGWDWLAAPQVPLAVVRGELSVISGGEVLRRMIETAPAGTPFIDIPGAYHHVMVDQPLALVSVLRTLMEAWA